MLESLTNAASLAVLEIRRALCESRNVEKKCQIDEYTRVYTLKGI